MRKHIQDGCNMRPEAFCADACPGEVVNSYNALINSSVGEGGEDSGKIKVLPNELVGHNPQQSKIPG